MTERLRAGRAAGVYAFVLALWLLAHVGLVSALLAQPPPLPRERARVDWGDAAPR